MPRARAMLVMIVVALFSCLLLAKLDRQPERMADCPPLMLWVWERPERLDFIKPSQTGVALLAMTATLRDDRILAYPRRQIATVPPGTYVESVVRIESDPLHPPTLSPTQLHELAQMIVAEARRKDIRAVQIDFDAARSARGFYRSLLKEVRALLPADKPLSITALASWCLYDNWLAGCPVDEVVPMLYRMGTDSESVKQHLLNGKSLSFPCRQHSLGIATDEPILPLLERRPLLCRSGNEPRIYVFRPRPWSASSYSEILDEVKKWQ